ncbi:hypothetical protein E4T38_04111 [Aureobasidium subglaciale]|nr:hypothetical protein E4T38_04111 [Aureobasidium subglaciale]KAI5224787.1 hypothetical protein E4T40_03886 [Aureobasidium subglaciale]KAI5228008.1 hypothetical protein E4T41_04106 [Aureobasidium subglaciale]KAI5263531.1 hypothetical protein E4T46_03727 [Aureobasidium subglaciale]
MALIYDRDLWPRQSFDPSCPSGGSWYACTTGSRFVGCCTGSTDPCDETTSCPQKNLKPASFDVAKYGTFPDQTCDADSNWFTCAGTNPAFMGCCKSNPCSSGCPTKDLTAASLSVDEAVASAFMTTSAAATTSTAAATIAPTAAASSFSAGDHVGAIAGGAVGGVAGITLIIIGIIWCLKRRNQARREERERQRMAEDYKNDDGHFHNTYTPRQADTPRELQPEDDEGPRRTVYSMEDPEGLEVDDRPQQATSTRPSTADQHLTSNTQSSSISPNISRPPSANNPISIGPPPSIGASWFTRDSIFTNGSPHLASIPSPDEQRRVSWIEQARHNGNNSPMITPIHSPLHNNQPDYFGAFENHQRQTSHATQGPISPQNQRFELDDTQLSPPVELEAIEATSKKQGHEARQEDPVHEPAQRRGRHDVEEGQTGSAYFSPDDIGKP